MASQRSEDVDNDGPHFLGLSAEICNLIYTEVLVSEETVWVTKHRYEVPALLRVNRQIRMEARAIYYLENHFAIKCPDFDPTALIAFRKQCKGLWMRLTSSDKRPTISVKCDDGQPRNWANLLRWAKARHKDPGMPRFEEQSDRGRRAGLAILTIVDGLRDLPWKRVRKIIEDASELCTTVRWR